MGSKSHFSYRVIIGLFIFIHRCVCETYDEENVFETKFTLDVYGENYIFSHRYDLEFNNNTKLFNNYSTIQTL